MTYEFKLFDKIIHGDLSPTSDQQKNNDVYIKTLQEKHGQCCSLINATFKKNKTKFILQSNSKINSLHPSAAIFKNNQLDLFEKMPVNELSDDVLKSLNINANTILSVEYKKQTNATILLIKEAINWKNLDFNESKYYYYNDILCEEVLRIKENIKDQVFNFKSNEKTEHFIHKLHQALVNLCFRLIKLLNYKEQNDIYLPSANFTNTDILNLTFISLEELIRFVEKNYLNYIDQNTQIPYRSSLVKIFNIDEKLSIVKSTLLNSTINPALLQIIYIPFLKLSALKIEARMTYKDLIYLNAYLQAFYDEILENDNTINEIQISELLYRINYNSFEIQHYKTSIITIQVASIQSIPDKIDYLYHSLKIVNQRRSKVNISFDTSLTSLKDQLTSWLEEEINYLNKKTQLQTKQQGLNLFSENDKVKLESGLTVAQLACFYKLQCDVGIITHKVQQDIFKHLSDSYQTSNVTEISMGSIKNKYYNFDSSTIEILKQKTIEILNHLKSH
jgi:hypothetical protein